MGIVKICVSHNSLWRLPLDNDVTKADLRNLAGFSATPLLNLAEMKACQACH
jgi:hypothetical protein